MSASSICRRCTNSSEARPAQALIDAHAHPPGNHDVAVGNGGEHLLMRTIAVLGAPLSGRAVVATVAAPSGAVLAGHLAALFGLDDHD